MKITKKKHGVNFAIYSWTGFATHATGEVGHFYIENLWRATLLNTRAIILAWVKTMTWKGLMPVVKLLETTCQKGIYSH